MMRTDGSAAIAHHHRMIAVIEVQGASLRRHDRPLIDMVARAHAYLEALTDGQQVGRKDVAKRFGVHPEDVSRVLPLAFLPLRIVEAISVAVTT